MTDLATVTERAADVIAEHAGKPEWYIAQALADAGLLATDEDEQP